MIPQPLTACAHGAWYPQFEKISIRSIHIPIPDDVRKYLLDDPIILPRECDSCLQPSQSAPFSDDDSIDIEQPEFTEFSTSLSNVISTLGGSVFLKTNWQAPKDAFWITAGQTLRVRDIADAYQLLKASSCTKEDVARSVEPQLLVVRQWMDIHPGTEFRCYVRDGALIAISPRDWPQFHGHIPLQKREIISDIRTLFLEHIKQKFELDDYCFDVMRDRKDHVLLVDFSPYGSEWSDALAFEWDELEAMKDKVLDDDPEFRYLTTDTGIQPSNKRNNYGIPRDVIDVYQQAGNSDSTTSDAQSVGGSQTLDQLLFENMRNVSDRQQPEND